MDESIETRGLTRSGLIKAGAVAALVVGTGGASRALASVGGPALPVSALGKPKGGAAYLHHQTFVPLVGSDFRVLRPGERTLKLKLVEARQLAGPGESFSLLFHGRAQPGVVSDIYRIHHPALGTFELFAGPVGRGVKGLDFEAVINRIAT
jgi:hypothetical protein